MLRTFLTLLIAVLPVFILQAQKKIVERPINFSDQNQIAPNLSFDGKELVYLTDQSNDGQMIMMHAKKNAGSWSRPKEITVFNSTSERNYLGGYYFTGDGKSLFYTVPKYGGMGGYDIWYSEKVAGNWETPKNIGKPINSRSHDGSPSLSPDGKTIYFMRCESMDRKQAKGCELYVAQKVGRKWTPAEKLPALVNAGGAMHPRIQVDGKTLVFAKEGAEHNLYQTKNINGKWTQPQSLDFINSGEAHEAFYTTDASSKVAWFSTKFRGKYQLTKAQIPEAFQIEPVHFIDATVLHSEDQQSSQVAILVYNSETKEMIRREKIAEDGRFSLILDQSTSYDISVIDFQMKRPYQELKIEKAASNKSTYHEMKVDFAKEPSFIDLQNITWNEDSTEISKTSEIAILRLAKYLKRNKGLSWYLGEPTLELMEEEGFSIEKEDDLDEWPSMWEEETKETVNEEKIPPPASEAMDTLFLTGSRQTLVDLVYNRLETYGLHPTEPTVKEGQTSLQSAFVRLILQPKDTDTFKFE